MNYTLCIKIIIFKIITVTAIDNKLAYIILDVHTPWPHSNL